MSQESAEGVSSEKGVDVFTLPTVCGLRPVREWKEPKLEHCIALFGSTRGDTAMTGWRNDQLLPMLRDRGVDVDANPPFNPVVDNWSVDDAKREVAEFQRNQFLAFNITKAANSITSCIELGAAEWGALTRGQQVFIHIEPVQEQELNPDARRARKLILSRIESMRKRFPQLLHVYDNMEQLADGIAGAYKGTATESTEVPILPDERNDLLQTVLISGTSGDRQEPFYQAELRRLIGGDATGLWQPKWDESPDAQRKESNLKERAAVKVHIISNDTFSLGALGETMALMVEAHLNGQRIAVVLEDGWKEAAFNVEPPKREAYAEGDEGEKEFKMVLAEYTQTLKDARNARTALVEHCKRYQEENPHGIMFAVSKDLPSDLPKVAQFATKALEDLRLHTEDLKKDAQG